MTRWFTTFLYALMLACAALPAHAALAAAPSSSACAGQEVQALASESGQPIDTLRLLDEPAHGDSGHELPELFLEPLRPSAPDSTAAEAVLQQVAGDVPSPCLEGPQRPPQAHSIRFD